MKTTAIVNGKIRESVESIIAEIPVGMRRYSIVLVDDSASVSGNHDCDYDTVVKTIESHREDIILWAVKTRQTARTFYIELRIK